MDDEGPDDDYMTTEQAIDAGWMVSEDVDEVKDLLRHLVAHPDPNHVHNAALILIRALIEPMPTVSGGDDDVRMIWARAKLDRLNPV